MITATLRWVWFWAPEKGYNPRVRQHMAGNHGVYAFRNADSKEVLYVGESHSGRLWRTAIRHFQGIESGKFAERAEWVWADRELVEVQVWLTRTGEQALALEAKLEEKYQPTQQSLETDRDYDLIFGREAEDVPF